MIKITVKRYCAFALLAFAAGCARPHIEPVEPAAIDSSALTSTKQLNCVLDVAPGKIKKCRPELGADAVGVSGQLQIDGVRPDRHWAPMVALELSSKDGLDTFRITFSIKEYKQDANGKALVKETPFTGVATHWSGKTQTWSQSLPAEILPATPFDFMLNWNSDGSVSIMLGSHFWKTEPLGFDVSTLAVTGSGVMVSTSDLSILQ